MINYTLKQMVLECGLDVEQRKISRSFYADYVSHITGQQVSSPFPFDLALELDSYYRENDPILYHEAEKINHCSYQRVKRLKNKIANMLNSGDCLFLTFTFTDAVLENTNENTRRQKVRRFLSQYNCEYVANIDFGKKNGREHYHAIIQTSKIDSSLYDYGALNFEKIRSTNDFVKLAKYITKLTNHALKLTAQGRRLIYNK